jgi:hypothetical protein
MSKKFCSLIVGTTIVVLAIVKPGSAEDETLGDGLVAHWKFEEGAGDVVNDSSGEGNDGIIVPKHTSMPKWGTGEFAGSVSFGGQNDHFVRIPPSASLNSLKRQISIIAFIYPMTLWTSDSYIVKIQRKWTKAVQLAEKLLAGTTDSEKAQAAFSTGYIAIVQRQWRETWHPDQYFLGYGPENNVLHYKWHLGLMGDEVSLYCLPRGQEKPQAGEWVHLAGTYNGETGKMSLYLDGKLICAQIHVGEIRLDPESLNRPLAIGAELNGPSTNEPTGEFVGYIRDVRIYNRALSDEEVNTLANEARRTARKQQ